MVVIDRKFGKYVHTEVEQKFLLATIPPDTIFHADITDHYIPNTTLRLRRMQTGHGVTFKFAQKSRVHPHETWVILQRNLPDRNAAKEMHDRSDRCAYHHPSVLLSHCNDDIHDLNHCGSKKNPRDSWSTR